MVLFIGPYYRREDQMYVTHCYFLLTSGVLNYASMLAVIYKLQIQMETLGEGRVVTEGISKLKANFLSSQKPLAVS